MTLVSWFIPEALKTNPITLAKAKILVAVAVVFALVVGISSLRGFLIGNLLLGFSVFLCALAMLVSAFVLRTTGSLKLSGNLFVFSLAVMLILASYQDGGANSQNQYNYIVVIIVAFLLCGLGNGLVWGIISLAIIVVFKTMKANGFEFPPVLRPDLFVNLMTATFSSLILAYVFERSNANSLKNFAAAKEASEQTTRQLQVLFADIDQVMSGVAGGDLSQRISTEVEKELTVLKQSINSALDMLGQTISQVKSAAQQIDSGSSQVSASAQALASGATEQAASLEEISSSMTEIGAKAKTNSENAQQAQTLSNQAGAEIEQGNSQMAALLSSMKKINETSASVAKVIKVIDEIAFQTNLLALNAAVEAARAGKYGKGFAVVAEEVRNLASRSAQAAKDTTQLIENSIKEVETGVNNADRTAGILTGFVTSTNKVTSLVSEIASASHEQANGASEVNGSLSHVNNVVQQNSSISEETASASQELSSQAEILMNLMNRFKLQVEAVSPKVVARQTKQLKPSPERASRVALPKATPIQKIPNSPERRKIVLDDDEFGKY